MNSTFYLAMVVTPIIRHTLFYLMHTSFYNAGCRLSSSVMGLRNERNRSRKVREQQEAEIEKYRVAPKKGMDTM